MLRCMWRPGQFREWVLIHSKDFQGSDSCRQAFGQHYLHLPSQLFSPNQSGNCTVRFTALRQLLKRFQKAVPED